MHRCPTHPESYATSIGPDSAIVGRSACQGLFESGKIVLNAHRDRGLKREFATSVWMEQVVTGSVCNKDLIPSTPLDTNAIELRSHIEIDHADRKWFSVGGPERYCDMQHRNRGTVGLATFLQLDGRYVNVGL